VAGLLFLTGFVGFIFARSVVLDQWKEASILKLQRAAHYIDMRLSRPIVLINMFHNTGEVQGGLAIQEWLLDQLRAMDGVSRVDLEWTDSEREPPWIGGGGAIGWVESDWRLFGVAGGVSILLILVLIRFISGKMVRTIQEISRAAEDVAKGDYGHPLQVKTADEIGQLITSFNKMVVGLKERDFIGNTFGRYVDQEIAKELLSRPEAIRLGGEKREVAILMSDIRNFTSLSESLNPEGTIRVINHYFSYMIEAIQKHRGIIVDFFGDSILFRIPHRKERRKTPGF
jgi:HAMP domain-containing protein